MYILYTQIFLVLVVTAKQFSKGTAWIFLLLYIFTNTVFSVFNFSHSGGYVVILITVYFLNFLLKYTTHTPKIHVS